MENVLDPNYVPEEYKVPYDVIELPSQGCYTLIRKIVLR